MTTTKKKVWGALSLFVGLLVCGTVGATIPSGWTCHGDCGTSGPDGVVTAPPNGQTSYQWISTSDGEDQVGVLPTGSLGDDESNGSTLATSVFSADAGTSLNFYFNYVTSDGAGYSDYAWAALFKSDGTLSALLFTARTAPSGSIVPGFGMPPVNPAVTLDPGSVEIIGGTNWSPLGAYSERCWATGCGHTDWVNASYTIINPGSYYLEIGAINWADTRYASGLAMSGVTVGGVPINGVPEPAAFGMFGLGVLLLGLFAGMRRRASEG